MKKLGFGCMRLPLLDETNPASVDIKHVFQMVDTFLLRGFTYFDTAYTYHAMQSEAVVREALVKRHPREAFQLATKLPTMRLTCREDQERIFAEQLQKCGVSYFDYYLLHELGAHSYETAKKLDSFSFVRQKKAEGAIRRIGFSFHDSAQLLDEILTEHPEMEFVQLQINYLDWDNESIQSRKCWEVARRHSKPVIVIEPVKGGTLANVPKAAEQLFFRCRPDRSIASWAIRFAASLDNVMMVLSGMSTLEQLMDNLSYMEQFEPLSEKEHAVIRQAAAMLLRSVAIPCTACRYCLDECPAHLPIPQFFALYNAEQQALNQSFSTQQAYYSNLTRSNGRASDCLGCKKCEASCPQHIHVADWMKAVANTFDH